DDDDPAAQCAPPRPRVIISVSRIGTGLLRASVLVSSRVGTNELQAITWNSFQHAAVTVDGVGSVQAGQRITFPSSTQGTSFLISRAPGAQSAMVAFTV